MKKFRPGIALVLLSLVVAGQAWAFVSFDDERYMHPDGGMNARGDGNLSLANDGAGNWVAASDGPYVSRSSDNGDTWTTPTLLAGGDYYAGALYTDPMVATDGSGTWLLVRMSWDGAVTSDEIYLWRSSDNGANWTAPVNLAAGSGTIRNIRPRLATDKMGNWMVVWSVLDPMDGDTDLMFATSSDNGMNWSPPAYLNPNAASDTTNDDYPSVATDGAGNWVVVYSYFGSGGNPSSWQVRAYNSTNFGGTWSGPAQINTHLGLSWPDVAAGGAGIFLSIHVKTQAILGRSIDGGASWTSKPISGQYTSFNGRPAHFDTDGNGEWVAVWDSDEDPTGVGGGDFDVLYSRSADNGVNWSTPQFVDPADAASETDEDSLPVVASGADGRWIAAWQRPYSDPDIHMAISDPLCPTARRLDCIQGESEKSSVSISNDDDNAKDRMKFKVSKAAATDFADFGNPVAGDDLLLCLWDADGDVDELAWRAILPGGVTCDGEPCWTAKDPQYSYADKETANSAFTKAKLKAGEEGKGSVSVQLAGTKLEPPRVPLDNDSSIAVQLISRQTDVCWGATFSNPKKNELGKYQAKSD